jgi:hypothetical protein
VTAGPDQNQRAGQAVSQGETAAHAHETAAQAQHRISGSTVAVETAATPDDHAVGWFGSNVTPAGPTPNNSGQNRSPNVSDPLDNSQSQP